MYFNFTTLFYFSNGAEMRLKGQIQRKSFYRTLNKQYALNAMAN